MWIYRESRENLLFQPWWKYLLNIRPPWRSTYWGNNSRLQAQNVNYFCFVFPVWCLLIITWKSVSFKTHAEYKMGIPQREFLFPHPLQSLLAKTTQDLMAQAVVFSSGQLLIMDTMQKPAHLLIPHMIVRWLCIKQSVIYSSINKFTTTSCMTFFFFSYVIMQVCPICLSNPKDMAFGCGHQVDYFSVKSNLFMTLS